MHATRCLALFAASVAIACRGTATPLDSPRDESVKVNGFLTMPFWTYADPECASAVRRSTRFHFSGANETFLDAKYPANADYVRFRRISDGVNLDITVDSEPEALLVFFPCLDTGTWNQMTVPDDMFAFQPTWNRHFVQRAGGSAVVWFSRDSHPVLNGIVRHTGEFDVSYTFLFSEDTGPTSLSNSLVVRNSVTGAVVTCVSPQGLGGNFTCGVPGDTHVTFEFIGWRGATGQPLRTPLGGDPVYTVNWNDHEVIDGHPFPTPNAAIPGSYLLWSESRTPQ